VVEVYDNEFKKIIDKTVDDFLMVLPAGFRFGTFEAVIKRLQEENGLNIINKKYEHEMLRWTNEDWKKFGTLEQWKELGAFKIT